MGQPSSSSSSVLDVDVSYYTSYYSTEATTVNLLSFLRSDAYRSEVEQLRKIADKAERDKQKAKLPAITPSGVFEGRSDIGLLRHSGFIQIDIDYKDNLHLGNFDQLKQELIKIKNVAYCGLSASGKGYWCLIPIAHPSKHRMHFKAIQRWFSRRNLIIDLSGINVSRMRGVSYDPTPYFKHDAPPLMLYDEPERYTPVAFSEPKDDEEARVRALCTAVQKQGVYLTDVYKEWFDIGCSIANTLGESGREYFHMVSQWHPKYIRRRTDKEYDGCLTKRYNYTIATLFYHCNRVGISM